MRKPKLDWSLTVPVALVAAIVLYVVHVGVCLTRNSNLTNRAAREVVELLQEKYPKLEFRGNGSPIDPRVYVYVNGAADNRVQQQIMERLQTQKESLYPTIAF